MSAESTMICLSLLFLISFLKPAIRALFIINRWHSVFCVVSFHHLNITLPKNRPVAGHDAYVPQVIVLGGGLSNVSRIYDDLPVAIISYLFSETC
jgi:hypothetical protein